MNRPENSGDRPNENSRGGSHDHDDGSDFDLSGFTQPSPTRAAAPKREASDREEHSAPRSGRSISGKVPHGKSLMGKSETGKFPPGKDDLKPRPQRDAFSKRSDARREYGDKPRRDDRFGGGDRGGKPFDRSAPRGDRGGDRSDFTPRESGPRDRARDRGFTARPPREGGARDYGSRPPREDGFRRDRDFGKHKGPASPDARKGASHPGPSKDGTPSSAPRYLRKVERVASAEHNKPVPAELKPFLPLKTDKGRWKESRFLLEGAKNIADVIAISPAILQTVFLTNEFKEKDKELTALIRKNRIAVIPVTEDDLKSLTDTETPQGILAVANFATLRPDWNTGRYVTLLDAVQDPGNVGAVLRTSLALGMDAVVLGKGCCDPYNPKVVRSSVGALMGMPFETGEDIGSKIAFLRSKGYSVVATSSHAKITLEQAKLRKKVALIMGNEGAGTGATYLDMADAVVRIPLRNKVESLNVAVAHGILSYQLINGRE